jgi:serine/threonine-protein kinase RsbW
MIQTASEGPISDEVANVVLLTVPASSAWLGVLRTTTACLASRLSFTLDEIEDLRIAVDEACVILLAFASIDATLSCQFTLAEALTIYTSVPIDSEAKVRLPSRESFAWQVLTTLVDDVTANLESKVASICLIKSRPGSHR